VFSAQLLFYVLGSKHVKVFSRNIAHFVDGLCIFDSKYITLSIVCDTEQSLIADATFSERQRAKKRQPLFDRDYRNDAA
jgi:hypothetical protein